ncbi:type II toxin-antitoxin system ParD family antitoxin [Xanthomonas cerealis pv. cerealis]|uniref:Antitoxin ParD n=2 Tax=Xanthomonas TaxID=338 RepID=A0A514EE53_9XANT|nr:type II toxin-antitoxin system ParD family antitoxin [Xanthomonas translucens pv. cerealis]
MQTLAIFAIGVRMATMNISLPDELKQFVDQQVAEHAYGSSSEYLRELIRQQRDVQKLRGLLLDGANSGPAMAMEPDFFDTMRKRARDRAAAK